MSAEYLRHFPLPAHCAVPSAVWLCLPSVCLVQTCRIVDGGDVDVRCIDFDWAGPAGAVRHPAFMNHRHVPWPEGVKEGGPAQQIHDMLVLKRHLPAVSTIALHELLAMQRPRHSSWRFGTLPLPTCAHMQRELKVWRLGTVAVIACLLQHSVHV